MNHQDSASVLFSWLTFRKGIRHDGETENGLDRNQMESLDSILSRVLQNASEKVAQRVQPALNRRPLRDPDNPAAVLQSVSAAIANIRLPETASAMSEQARRHTSIDSSEYQSPAGDYSGSDFGNSSSPADGHRKTTIADDASTLGTVGSTGAAIFQQILAAGKAFSGIPEAAESFREAVSGMADSASSAAPAIETVSGPLSKMAGAIVSHISGTGNSGQDQRQAANSLNQTATNVTDVGGVSGVVQKILKAPASFSSWFGGGSEKPKGDDGPSGNESQSKSRTLAGAIPWGSIPRVDGFFPQEKKASGPAQQWLNSSSIADSLREVVANVRESMGKIQANSTGLVNGGLSASRFSGGIGVASGGGDSSSLSGRISDSFDRVLARSFSLFRSMSPAASSGSSGGGGGNNGGGGSEDNGGNDASNNSGGSGMFRGIRNQIRGRIGRTGRRMMTKFFRNRVTRGRTLLRGGAGGGGGGFAAGGVPAGGGAGGIGAAARGIGGVAGAGGGMAGGAAGGGGAAAAGGGGAAGVGVVAGGAALAILAFVAALAIAIGGVIKLGKQGYETALRVAHLDGGLTEAKAQLDVSRLMRDIHTARNLSESGSNFMAALDNLEDAFRPLTDGAFKLGLEGLTFITNGVADGFRALVGATSGLVKSLNEFEQWLGQDFIPDDLAGKMEEFAKGNARQNVQLEAAPLHQMFLNMPPAAPPRRPHPPLGGN